MDNIKKRILFIIPSLGQGGAERQVITLARQLMKRQYYVEILTFNEDNFYRNICVDNNLKISIIKEQKISRVFKMRQFIVKGRFDVSISFMDVSNFYNNIVGIARFGRWRVITSERNSLKITFESRLGKIFAKFQKSCDYIVCNSQNAMSMWNYYFPNYSDKLRVIYNNVILQNIDSTYKLRESGKTHILVAASYSWRKNPKGLIQALCLMSDQERQKIVIDWYGRKQDGGDTNTYYETESLVKANKLQDVLKLHDATDDIANIMNKSDVIALFSQVEGLPNTICEGMTIGKPIILSNVSDYNVLVNGNGYLCEWNKPESIKKALLNVSNISDNELLFQGKKSKEKALELFSPEAVINKWIDLIDN